MEANVRKTKMIRISRQSSPTQIKIDQKQPEDVEYFNFLGSLIINDATCTREIQFRIGMAKAAFNKMTLVTSK